MEKTLKYLHLQSKSKEIIDIGSFGRNINCNRAVDCTNIEIDHGIGNSSEFMN